MSTEVENKVVSVQFDNASFGKKLSDTIADLGRFKQSLNLDGAKKGFNDLAGAAKNFNVGEMGRSVEGISAKFLALSTIGITALATLTQRAIEAGSRMAAAFTITPAVGGFQEFELKMGSIQTIMAGSGESLDVVNKKLGDLNAYSDRTIYSFKDMTSNIGKFTNAGVDLDKSVASIQGIANVAALSGANAEEASRSMYNFAQALSSGSVKLMDWKSIELANMATVEFKQQLIDSATAMGTLTKEGDHWKTKAGNIVTATKGFNESLSDQWLTSDALVTTLGKYSDTTTDIGKRATAAAQDVKTFSQMIDTIKESIGSGWAQTFEIFFGNFEEGKKLWTGLNNAISGFVGNSAKARNELLQGWKDLGGRDLFFGAFKTAAAGFATILKPIKEAFREIFPKKTSQDLLVLTQKFADLMERIKIGGDTAEKVKSFFKGFFAVISIGWEILKGVTKVFFALAGLIWKVVGPIVGLAAGSGELVAGLHGVLVQGKGIETFFDSVATVIGYFAEALAKVVTNIIEFVDGLDLIQKGAALLAAPIKMLKAAAGAIKDFVASLDFSDEAKESTGAASKGLEQTAGLFDKLFAALKNVFGQIGDFLGDVVGHVAGAFKGLGGAIADALGSGDFGQVLNIIKTGLLGGILAMLIKFFRNGLKFDFGQGRIMDKIGEALDTVTSGLKSLQANVRADTLIKIATAMGILALAVIGLSLVDAEALAKAMAAIAAGFAQMTAVMMVLEKRSAGGGTIKLLGMASAMIALSIAMALLVIPIKILSTMDMVELAKGIGGVGVAMLVMAQAVSMIGNGSAGIVRAGAAMILISVALIVLSKAIKSFSEMNLIEMGFGLAQAALGIGLLILALKHMPDDIARKGLGLLILALALRSLAKVVQLFAGISFGVLAKGFLSISLGLAGIGLAMDKFPDDMIAKSVALIAVSGALYLMAMAVQKMGNIPFGELAKGVGALGVMLAVVAVAVNAMSQSGAGVVGLLAASVGLLVIGKAIAEVGKLDFGTILKGVLGLAAVLIVLGIASQIAPALLLLGVALAAIGLAFILVGAGIALAGKGLELFAKYGSKAMGYITEAMQELVRQLPGFVSAFVRGIMDAIVEIGNGIPEIVGSIEKILTGILEAVQRVIPKIADVVSTFIGETLGTFRERIPDFVETGFAMLTGFLTGIRDNIGEVVTLVSDIVTNFLDAMAEEIPDMVDSLVDLYATLFQEVARGLGELMPRLMIGVGRSFLEGFWHGITDELGKLKDLIGEIISDVIGAFKSGFGIFSPSTVMADIGKNIIQGLLNGLGALLGLLKTFFIELPLKALSWIGNVAKTLWNKGTDFIGGLLGGLKNKIVEVASWYKGLAGKVLGWIGDVTGSLKTKGMNFISGLANGISERIGGVRQWFFDLPGKLRGWIGDATGWLKEAGKNVIRGLWNGISSMKDWVVDKAGDVAGWVTSPVQKGLDILGAPSRVFCDFGHKIGKGLVNGLDDSKKPIEAAAKRSADSVNKAFESIVKTSLADLAGIDDSPVIRPVLDLSEVESRAKRLQQLVGAGSIRPDASLSSAELLARATNFRDDGDDPDAPAGSVTNNYNQTINAPKALDTRTIYRQSKNLVSIKKGELESK